MVEGMYTYTLIESDETFSALYTRWKQGGIKTVAMDFEGEFNLHIYGEHLALVQLYDNSAFYLVDPLAVSMELLKEFFEDASIEKIMFDCASDTALMRKSYQVEVASIYDLRLHALALEHTGGLTTIIDTFLGDSVRTFGGSKRRQQRTNWLRRPLKEEQIQYAIEDVAHLFVLRARLEEAVAEAGLAETVAKKMASVGEQTKGELRPGWAKLPGWRYLNKRERIYTEHFFLARDRIAQKHNVPAARIWGKRKIVDAAKATAGDPQGWRTHAQEGPKRFQRELKKELELAYRNATALL